MHIGKFVFSQIILFLPQRQFNRIVSQYNDRTRNWGMSHWSHLLVLIFGQLVGCESLRGLTDLLVAHRKKSFHLGFGSNSINRQMLSKANNIRDYRIFEDFAFFMIAQAQKLRIETPFDIPGRFYAVDSSTIDLCMTLFRWADFRSTKSGIKLHTQIDIVTHIPTFYRITNAKVHDVNYMDYIAYEATACYVFDRGYFDYARLYMIERANAFFVIREKRRTRYAVVSEEQPPKDEGNILKDQTIRFKGKRNSAHYPDVLRRIVYYAPELDRTFVYYTNNFYLKASDIALLYKNRWQVELFFKWIKQHLRVKQFWGRSENAVRIQIHVAIITYCLVGIIEHELMLNRPIIEVMRILGGSLLTQDNIKELFTEEDVPLDDVAMGQLRLDCDNC